MNNENNDVSKRNDRIIKIVLIVIIILLLLYNFYLLKKGKEGLHRVPTGNVDIIEIICDKDNLCKTTNDQKNNDNKKDDNKTQDETTDDNSSANNNEDDNSQPVNGDYTPPEDYTGLLVYDKEINWHDEVSAKIFTNSMYELTDVIAPESSNTYQFVVKNSTDYNLKYDISFIETNQYNINMKFRLRKNDTYLIDNYVSASELITDTTFLDSKTSDTYYLEWKWFSSDNDTEIGKNPNANYSLKIDIKAESVND